MFRLVGVLVVVFLSGCTTVNHIPLSPEASGKLKDKSIVRTQYTTPDFTAFTAGKAAFAMVGAIAAISEGNQIVKDNEIPDPAIAIGEGLSERLVKARSVSVLNIQRVASNDDIDSLIKDYPGSDYLLDTKTLGWMFVYYPTDWSHYRVVYNARLRLIDTKAKTVIAETMCKSMQGDDKNPPTKDQLLADKAALLKQYLNKSAEDCASMLSKDILLL